MMPMGYRGKTVEQARARELRAQGWTIKEIAGELRVSQGSVSVWARDVEVDPAVWAERVETRRNHGWEKRRATFEAKRKGEDAADLAAAHARLGALSDRDLLVTGIALYAGEGAKRRGSVTLPNSDPRMIVVFLAFLRRFFDIDESRLRVRLYLHSDQDLVAANDYWSRLTGIPLTRFTKPYRAIADDSYRTTKHPFGCPAIRYSCTATHRAIMSLSDALLSSIASQSGVAQLEEQGTVNAKVCGFEPHPRSS